MPMLMRRAAAGILLPSTASPGRLMGAVNQYARRWTGKRNLRERVRQAAEMLLAQSPAAVYHYMMSFWKQPPILMPGIREPHIPATDRTAWPNLGGVAERLFMYLDLVEYLPDDILVKLDRASMGVSLEARIPLLDHRVIEFAWRTPQRFKFRGHTRKWILRQVLYKYVPPSLVDRPKQGFGLPIANWLQGPLRDWAEALLDEHRLRDEGILEPRVIRQKWAEHLSKDTRCDYELWTVLMFQAWMESRTQVEQPAHAA